MSYPGYPYNYNQPGYPTSYPTSGYPQPQQPAYPTQYSPAGYPPQGYSEYPGQAQPAYQSQPMYPGQPQAGQYPTSYPQSGYAGYPATTPTPQYPYTGQQYPSAGQQYPSAGQQYPSAGQQYPSAGAMYGSAGSYPQYPAAAASTPAPNMYGLRRGPEKTKEQLAAEAFLSVDQISNLEAHFRYADQAHQGYLRRPELEQLWHNAFQQPANQEALDWMLRQFDVDNCGLKFGEFALGFGTFSRELQEAKTIGLALDTYYALRRRFGEMDRAHTGQLSVSELRTFLQLGAEVSDQQLAELVRRVDRDGSGTVSFLELMPFVSELYKAQQKIEAATPAPVQPAPEYSGTVQYTPASAPVSADHLVIFRQ